jgi:hypothetical protein
LEEVRAGNLGDLVFEEAPSWFAVQAKVGIQPNPWGALAEATAASKGGQFPVALLRRNRKAGRPKQDIAVMEMDDFFEMVEMLAVFVWGKDV